MLGQLLTAWTIRLALAFYVAWLAGWLCTRDPRWAVVARWLWTAGCVLFVAHVICAFQFYHHWSHAHAWKDTAEQTQALLGVSFGDGIYFSYVFLVLWVADVVLMWCAADPLKTPWPRVLVHLFLFFIAFNGAIVFEAGPTRPVGIVACLALGALAARAAYLWGQSKVAAPQPAFPTPDS